MESHFLKLFLLLFVTVLATTVVYISYEVMTHDFSKDTIMVAQGLSSDSGNHHPFSINGLEYWQNNEGMTFNKIGLKSSNDSNKISLGNLPPDNRKTLFEKYNTSGAAGIPKVIILSFDDGKKGNFNYAKPILDKYGFKATFFIICGFVSEQHNDSMNWQEVNALAKDGMDIESHTMSHPHLNELSQVQLEYEIGGSKKCIDSHGYNTTVFAYPYNDGSNNVTIVNTVAKYYEIARTGSEPLMFLDCQGFKKHNQKDCSTFNEKGKLNFANRYDVRSYTVDRMEMKNSFDEAKIFSDFVNEANSQSAYNKENGKIMVVPLITFHDVGPAINTDYVTNYQLFDKMMKYLHDNDFRVLTFKQLGYNSSTKEFYIKGLT